MSDSYIEQVQARRVIAEVKDSTSAVFATRVDTATTAGVTYVGKAAPGTTSATASWQIQRIDESGTPETTIITFADGNANFDNVWTNRASLNYS